jgi:hypothetical protein
VARVEGGESYCSSSGPAVRGHGAHALRAFWRPPPPPRRPPLPAAPRAPRQAGAAPAAEAASDSESGADDAAAGAAAGPLPPDEWRAAHAMVVLGDDPPAPMQSFEDTGFPRKILQVVG